MTMFARLRIEADEDAVVALARMQVEETLPHLDFDEATARRTFRRAIEFSDSTFFVVEQNREVIGFLQAMMYPYSFTTGIFVSQEVIYVRPDKRGTRAAALLLVEFGRWADMLRARESFTGIANGFKVEKTAKFMKRFGYEPVGYSMRRIRDEQGR